jgi:hydrogenase maturation factor
MSSKAYKLSTLLFDVEGALVCANRAALKSGRGPAIGWALRPGAKAALAAARSKGLNLILFSRHGRRPVSGFLQNRLPAALPAATLICREDLISGGRCGNPLKLAAAISRMPAGEMLVVSGNKALLRRARDAGATTVRLSDAAAGGDPGEISDFQIAELGRLKDIVRMGVPLPAGKLPNDLLRQILEGIAFADPSLLINPGVGEDIAAVDVESEEVLVLKSDPITFATDAIGRYAVLVNANDIATAGARPRWLLTTLLFPIGSTGSLVRRVAGELADSCRRWEITLCGGHTEITDAVTRPVVSGMMAGTVRRAGLIYKQGMAAGDHILFTKAAAVEGTAIISREFGSRLRALGMAAAEIEAGKALLDRISIIPEARIAAASAGTSAMHDVTEGGVATALEELGAAGGHAITVELDRIPVFPETRRICRLVGVRPFGLIGSGSLLICCRPKFRRQLEARLKAEGIPVAWIGRVAEKGHGVRATRKGRPAAWTRYEVDEIARLFSQNGL